MTVCIKDESETYFGADTESQQAEVVQFLAYFQEMKVG
jgi:hypothetical protein